MGLVARAEEFGDLLDQKFRTWEVSGSFTQPIFNAGRLRANIRRNKALLNAAEARYRFIALRAFTEIETLLTNELFLQEEETHLMNAANSASKAAQTSWDRYQRGLLDIFDTLDSQRRAFEAESRLLDLSKERVFNRIQLFLPLELLHSHTNHEKNSITHPYIRDTRRSHLVSYQDEGQHLKQGPWSKKFPLWKLLVLKFNLCIRGLEPMERFVLGRKQP